MALLHVLAKLAPRLGVALHVVAVDHGLRAQAAEEARGVSRMCRGLGIPCEVVAVDVSQARRPHVSVQEAARNARLRGLEAVATRLGCVKIALGHTADDQAETVLFRLLRGTGIAGLAGIPYQRGPFIRPLLDVRRAQILAFLGKRQIEFFSDPSNADRRYARSRVRHDVLPVLARENPRVVEALLSLSREARAAVPRPWLACLPKHLYLSRRTREVVDGFVRKGEGTRTVTVEGGAIVVRYGAVTWEPAGRAVPAVRRAPPRTEKLVTGPGTFGMGDSPPLMITAGSSAGWPSGNAVCFDRAKVRWPLVPSSRR